MKLLERMNGLLPAFNIVWKIWMLVLLMWIGYSLHLIAAGTYHGVLLPGLFATEIVSDKGKIKKVYRHENVKTPLECLVQLNEKGLVKFKTGITLEDLRAQASEKTDPLNLHF